MDSYRLGFAIEDFHTRMAALGIEVAAIELADDASRHAVLAALRPACIVTKQTEFAPGVIARVCGVEIKAAESRRRAAAPAGERGDG